MTEQHTPRRRGQGRKPTGVRYPRHISVPVSDEQGDWLDIQADRQDIPIAEVIRRLIDKERGE